MCCVAMARGGQGGRAEGSAGRAGRGTSVQHATGGVRRFVRTHSPLFAKLIILIAGAVACLLVPELHLPQTPLGTFPETRLPPTGPGCDEGANEPERFRNDVLYGDDRLVFPTHAIWRIQRVLDCVHGVPNANPFRLVQPPMPCEKIGYNSMLAALLGR